MKQLTIISGKGGTGKTTLTAAFAALTDKTVLADYDVDAAGLSPTMTDAILARTALEQIWQTINEAMKGDA